MYSDGKNDSKNGIIEDYDAHFEALLKNITTLVTEDDALFSEYAKPASAPPLKTSDLALQIATVIREEFIADIAVRGPIIRMKFQDRAFVLKVCKA